MGDHMTRPLTVGIMGAGAIAAGFDAPGDSRILTLAHAVSACRSLRLGGFFDVRRGRAMAAESKWGCPPSPRTRTEWLDARWDVVVIATPDEEHARDCRDALLGRPRAILVEKPFAPDGREALRLMSAAKRLRIPLLVDFPRREHPGILHVTKLIRSGALGAVRRVSGTCSGGLRHSGIHILDLVAGLVPSRRVRLVSRHTGTAHLELLTSAGPAALVLSAASQAGLYVWELQIDTTRARIELSGAPEMLRLFVRGTHPNYPGFSTLMESRAWGMEDDPLLLRVVRRLARLAGSGTGAQHQWALESGRQRFFNRVFELVPNQ
jgi:predicted dehydrogenase